MTASDYSAAHSDCVAFPVPDRVLVEFRGADRARFLHNFCTNDIKALPAGRGCEAIFTNIKARAVGHGFVFADEQSHWLETGRHGLTDLLAHLDKYLITDDVEIVSHDGLLSLCFLTGPNAVAQAAKAVDAPDADIPPLSLRTVGDTLLLRTDMFGLPGVMLAVPADRFSALQDRLADQGVPVGEASTFEVLRIESGFPAYGGDVTDEHLAPEVDRIAQTISYRKGCYLGQEPIARIDALGHTNKSLVRIRVHGQPAPAAGETLLAADGTAAGSITSAAELPGQDDSVALAWVQRAFREPGTELTAGGQPAIVAEPSTARGTP